MTSLALASIITLSVNWTALLPRVTLHPKLRRLLGAQFRVMRTTGCMMCAMLGTSVSSRTLSTPYRLSYTHQVYNLHLLELFFRWLMYRTEFFTASCLGRGWEKALVFCIVDCLAHPYRYNYFCLDSFSGSSYVILWMNSCWRGGYFSHHLSLYMWSHPLHGTDWLVSPSG